MWRIVCIVTLVLVAYLPVPAKASDTCPPIDPDSGGTPPCCDNERTLAQAADVEKMMMSDYYHEHAVIIDCTFGDVMISATGGIALTNYQATLLQTMNSLAVHSHPIYTMPSIQDMRVFSEANVLAFRLIGYDVNAKTWQRCTFRKASWREAWPKVDIGDLTRKESLLIWQKSGNYYARINAAQYDLWLDWSLENNVSMTCTRIA